MLKIRGCSWSCWSWWTTERFATSLTRERELTSVASLASMPLPRIRWSRSQSAFAFHFVYYIPWHKQSWRHGEDQAAARTWHCHRKCRLILQMMARKIQILKVNLDYSSQLHNLHSNYLLVEENDLSSWSVKVNAVSDQKVWHLVDWRLSKACRAT